jgi:hypothetical protein
VPNLAVILVRFMFRHDPASSSDSPGRLPCFCRLWQGAIMTTRASMAPEVSCRISVCTKGRESHLRSLSWPSIGRCNPGKMHDCSRRTGQRRGPVGTNPSKQRTCWAHKKTQEERAASMTSRLLLHQIPTQCLRCNHLLLREQHRPLSLSERMKKLVRFLLG